jgi:hypothetical protein
VHEDPTDSLLARAGSGGGTSQTIQEVTDAIGQATSAQGWYAQAQSGTLFDGQQLLWRMDQIVQGGGVFQPAVMPTGEFRSPPLFVNGEGGGTLRISDVSEVAKTADNLPTSQVDGGDSLPRITSRQSPSAK